MWKITTQILQNPCRRALSRTFASEAPKAISPIPSTLQALLRTFPTSEPTAIISLDRKVFGAPLRRDILHRVVVWQRDALRQGTHSTKGRADVRGSSRKILPQKGTGGARHGSIRAPQFRGGGIPFGPKPRDHTTELPVRVRNLGLRVALSTKYAQNQLVVVDSLALPTHKTQELAHIIQRNQWDSILFIIGNSGERKELELAARNLPGVEVLSIEEVGVYELLKREVVIAEEGIVRELERRLSP
ncbi:mitochondrial 54S ribosomal protein uL4m [Calcarisporiella thermophila]|uniref:mitochondrial 54S ribosomal protein uL4m n=1 Tax=Calcarisporiella thermophila TaxID=911321 RepID=UPI003743B520